VTDILPFSAACERNKDVILEKLSSYLSELSSVLEIGSGTAQHAVHFARAYPGLKWQTSDQKEYIEGIQMQLKYAELDNVLTPLQIDVKQPVWDPSATRYPAIYTANTLHIMNEGDVRAFFDGLPNVMTPDAMLYIYGPFKYNGAFTSSSNQDFDQSLRSRGVGSAIRDFEFIEKQARDIGLSLLHDHKMPANNQLLVFKASSSKAKV